MTRPTANVVAGYRGDEGEYTIAYTLSDPSSTDIVPTNLTSDGYITANIWGNVLCGNVTTSGSITGSGSGLTSLNADNITSGTLAVSYGGTGASTLNNLIQMGTHTTGDYVATITGGDGISSSGATSGETIAHTLSVDRKLDGGLVIQNGELAVDLSASSITGTLAVSDGGTGLTTYTAGELLYASGATSLTSLGIGSGGDVLTVNSAGTAPEWQPASGGGFTGDITDYITHTNNSGAKFGFPSDNVFVVYTASSERFRIRSDGNVGIGTTSPNYKLHVNGTGYFTNSLTASSFSGSGSGLTSLNASNISSGTLAVVRGGTGQSSYSTGDILYYNGSTLTRLAISSSPGDVLTVSGGLPSWQAASGGGSGGMTAGEASISHFSTEISASVTGGPYDYMYNQNPYNIGSSSSAFSTINIQTAMTPGQKLIMKLYTSGVSCEAKIVRSRDLSVTIDGSNHTINKTNFRDHALSFPYDTDPTPNKFLILEITKEDTQKVSIEAKLSNAEFTKSGEIDASWSSDYIDTNNYDTAIHNIIHGGLRSINGTPFKFRFSYFGVGHSHDIYFQQDDPGGLSVSASSIEFYYNNSTSSWTTASQTNVYTNFDKSTNLEFANGKYYHIHHEVIVAGTDDYPSAILFTVEEMNAAASSGGGGGGSYGTSDFTSFISGGTSYIDISPSFSPSNYNFNSTPYTSFVSQFQYIDLAHTLPSSLPLEYEFLFTSSYGVSASFEIRRLGNAQPTKNSFPAGGTSWSGLSTTTSNLYSVKIKSIDTSHSTWLVEWSEYT